MSWCVAAACWVIRVSGLPGPEPHIFVVHDTDNGSRERTSLGQALSPRVPQRNIRVNSVSIPARVQTAQLVQCQFSTAISCVYRKNFTSQRANKGGASFLFFFNASLISRRGKIDTTRLVMRELPHRARGAGSDSNTGIAIDCFGY